MGAPGADLPAHAMDEESSTTVVARRSARIAAAASSLGSYEREVKNAAGLFVRAANDAIQRVADNAARINEECERSVGGRIATIRKESDRQLEMLGEQSKALQMYANQLCAYQARHKELARETEVLTRTLDHASDKADRVSTFFTMALARGKFAMACGLLGLLLLLVFSFQAASADVLSVWMLRVLLVGTALCTASLAVLLTLSR